MLATSLGRQVLSRAGYPVVTTISYFLFYLRGTVRCFGFTSFPISSPRLGIRRNSSNTRNSLLQSEYSPYNDLGVRVDVVRCVILWEIAEAPARAFQPVSSRTRGYTQETNRTFGQVFGFKPQRHMVHGQICVSKPPESWLSRHFLLHGMVQKNILVYIGKAENGLMQSS
ncbi:hypothetical protein K491DRAFT_680586 [Lophiostoma macrostomum CBS 122681]|uniref:Uncharacterized protein n=1 Tax=Lophiostoma macrostomum CBS 122681 TaxID=1314788 RepID=A0A6A6T3A8_9PLEO|nr:hypothetical protein K491DRAFT_680586 [Lophiostoma macrostomum CBS 122681]